MHEPTRDQDPPLTWRGHLWRVVAVLAISGIAWSAVVRSQWHEARVLFWLDLGVGLVTLGLSQLRRRWPLAVALLTNAAGAVSVSSAGPGLLAAVSLATGRRVPQVVLVGVVGVVAGLAFDAIEPGGGPASVPVTLLAAAGYVVALVLVGRYLASRRARPTASGGRRERAARTDRAPMVRWDHDTAAHDTVPQPTPEQYNPALTWRGHLWRVLVVVVISGLLWTNPVRAQWRTAQALVWLDLGVGLATLVLSFYRRRWPLAVAVITNAAGIVSMTATGPGVLASVSLATRRRIWQIVLVGVVGLLGTLAFGAIEPQIDSSPLWVDLAVGIAFTVALLVWGMYLGSRRELLWTLRDRAESAEAEQGLRVARAQSDERARIAREMHDVLAHRISLITMHAGALAYRTDLSADEMRETAALIQAKSHEALTDLRQVLGVLRGSDASQDGREPPQPTFCDLGSLVEEAEQSGMRVRYAARVHDAEAMPEPVGRAAYRIVQEGLTNARKHAPGATVVVDVTGSSGDGVHIRVRNPSRQVNGGTATPGAGLGLVGLMERASLAGGRLEGRRDDGFFELDGWLPWNP